MQAKAKRLIKSLFFHETWDILIAKNNRSHAFPANTLDILSHARTKQLKKKYTFQADPFIIEKDDKVYVFYEAMNFRDSQGTLRCRILNAELDELEDVKLEGFDNIKCHLSFPFLYQSDDKLFMIPESSERKEVILFESTDFPVHWHPVKVLISDIALTDNILFELNGVLYLASTTMDDELVIHAANDITGPWQKITPELHISNPYHRGAGAPCRVNGKTYFFTQECTPESYGKSVYIKELVTLNAHSFVENLIEQINSGINQSDGVHTLNFTDNFIVYDSKINKFSLFSALKKVNYKLKVKSRKNALAGWR
ncbi:hypothetical protein ABG794_01610 [Enterobacter soli]|uniref:glucosamine inositolphosphorylceramide transferase family protein n=1 Tax=Enterobacter soli TaxID=885040 RepID=UPI00325A8BAC